MNAHRDAQLQVGQIVMYDGAFFPTTDEPETTHYTVEAKITRLTEECFYVKPLRRFVDARSEPRPYPPDQEEVAIDRDDIQESLKDGVYQKVVIKQTFP